MVRELAAKLKLLLGSDAYYLTKLIPNLAIILGPDPGNYRDEGCVNAQKRLQYFLCRFVEVISSTFSTPVTLFLDDLQWADAASIAVVDQILFSRAPLSHNYFFFLGCYREGEIDESSPLQRICNGGLLNIRSTHVKLDYMGEDTLNMMVSETLHLSPRLTRPLSSIMYHKTKGNPFFLSKLMTSLSREGLLRLSLSNRRWEWDLEKIQCQALPDDVVGFLTHSIRELPQEVQTSLRILSCFGASLDSVFVRVLERAIEKQLLINFDVAVNEGLLDKVDDQYRFSHDRIQEAVYNMIDIKKRCIYHFEYGLALASMLVGTRGDNNVLFTAVNQLNLGGTEAVADNSQNIVVATLNLKAGKKAMDMSDFTSAYSYFDHGITFLRKNHWKEHYALSLELYELAARCALTNGDVVILRLLSEQVVTYGRSFEDKLNTIYYATCALASSSKLPEAITKGIGILGRLGIDLRDHDLSMEDCIQETKNLLSGYTDHEILNSRQMVDPTTIVAMKFLGKLELAMTQTSPLSVPHVAQKIIHLSLSYGMSPVSPIGFVYFGASLAKIGNIDEGYHYVKLALSLLDKVGSRENAGEVIAIGTQVRAYVEPLQAALEYHNEGYAAAMKAGDVNQAMCNSILYNSNSLFAGVNLEIMRGRIADSIRMMEQRQQLVFLIQLQQIQRSMLRLTGTYEEDGPKYAAEEQEILTSNNSALKTHFFHLAYINFMFRSYEDTKDYIEKYFACSEKAWAALFMNHAVHAFYIGLISFWVTRKSRNEQEWNVRGSKSKAALKQWAQSSRWTFENKVYLLEAEESYCNNDFDAAKTFYDKAISSAKEHKVREGVELNELETSFLYTF